MKKSSINFLVLILATVLTLGSCGSLKKMADNAHLVTYSVSPSPLEMHAGMVPVSVNVTFPPKYFHKKAYLVISPFIVSDNDKTKELALKVRTIQGEKVKDNNPDVISYKNGGSVSYKDTVPYEAIYRMSDLELRISANAGAAPIAFGNVKIADGIITTPELVDQGLKVDNGSVGTGTGSAKTILAPPVSLPTSATAKAEPLKIYFEKQQSAITSKEQKDKKITDFVSSVKTISTDKEKEVVSVSVASYASPDGTTELNGKLVEDRYTTSQKFLADKMKKEGVKGAENAKFLSRTTTSQEDWDGFKTAVSASKIEDKELILKVLTMYSDWNVRDKEIKNMSKVYPKLANDILPILRRSEVTVEYKTTAKTKDQVIAIAKTSPKDLTATELLYAGQEATGADKETFYKAYLTTYPTDVNAWKANNNLGVYYIGADKLSDAKTYLEKANTLEANNASIMNNLGAMYMALYLKNKKAEDLAKAQEYFTKAYAKASNDDIGYNLGVILIKQGKYSDAVTKFGSTASFNKALAQLLTDKPENASSTLKSVTSTDAYVYYLKAIAAAGQDKEADVLDNLKTAVGKNSALKAYAKNDMEFNKYFENATFKAIVE